MDMLSSPTARRKTLPANLSYRYPMGPLVGVAMSTRTSNGAALFEQNWGISNSSSGERLIAFEVFELDTPGFLNNVCQ